MKKVSQRRKDRFNKNRRKSSLGIFKLLAIFLIPVVLFLLLKINTRYWNGDDKVSIAIQRESGEVEVLLLDPELTEETSFIIPADTEISVSKNLGTMRIKNVWQLGENEGVGGKLLPQTITKNFFFPVMLWSDEPPEGLKFITTKNSNIPMGDRISIMLFTHSVKSLSKNRIDLGKSQFLTKVKLSDGLVGYRIPGSISERLTFYFSDNSFSENILKAYLIDATGSFGIAENVGHIIEVMGGKIVTVERAQKEEVGCVVWGGNKEAVKKISNLFDCKVENKNGNFDVEMKFGSEFSL